MHVGGGKADGAAALVAWAHDALQLVAVAEQRVGVLDHAVGEGGADRGRGADVAVRGHRVDRGHRAAVGTGDLPQQLDIALAAVAEAEIPAGGDGRDRELAQEAAGHEVGGGGAEQAPVAAEDIEMVDAEAAQQLGLAAQGREARRGGGGVQDLARVRLERDHAERAAKCPRMTGGGTDHLAVAAMDAVEVADRHRGTARCCRQASVITVDEHGALCPMRPRACKEASRAAAEGSGGEPAGRACAAPTSPASGRRVRAV